MTDQQLRAPCRTLDRADGPFDVLDACEVGGDWTECIIDHVRRHLLWIVEYIHFTMGFPDYPYGEPFTGLESPCIDARLTWRDVLRVLEVAESSHGVVRATWIAQGGWLANGAAPMWSGWPYTA
jgi:hypothetical protein